jgi:transposase-like protein
MMEVMNLPGAGNTNTNSVDPQLVCELCYKSYQRRTVSNLCHYFSYKVSCYLRHYLLQMSLSMFPS